MNTYTVKVVDIRVETEDTITLCFKQPGLRKIKYLAGQYLTLIFRINGRRYIRPYSFSSAPQVDQLLEVTIKRVVNGIVSNHIHDVVTIGDNIEVIQPMGDFILEEVSENSIFLWGVGSGITPLISIAKQALATTDKTVVNLIYGNKNHESTIFFDQIRKMENLYSNRFKVHHFHTKPVLDQMNFKLIEGRIDQKGAKAILLQTGNLEKSTHFICGPAGLKESVKLTIGTLAIDNIQILTEDFELVKDPKDFENIKTEEIKLQFLATKHNLEVVKGKTILESALDAGLELPYSCQTGNCSTCKAKLIAGKVKMIGLTKDRDDLLADEYLLCCSHPLTDNVYIEI